MKLDLTGKVALVSGGSQGIGLAIVETLAAAGATVWGTSRDAAKMEQAAAPLLAKGLRVKGAALESKSRESAEACAKTVLAADGKIDILVNNAGITRDKLMLMMKPEDWSEVIDTNLNGLFYLTHPVMKAMLKAKQGGRIINISSVVGQMGNPGQANYCSAKAGVLGFTKSLARELGGRQITVNAVTPGFIETPMTHGLTDEQKSAMLGIVPLQRMGTPADIANAVAFLASDAAGYITGQVLSVNGGMYM
jgi:3-oxoacyl-[acyl-carrier protein] reductase